MGAVTELPVPPTGAVTDLKVPDTGQSGTPEEKDLEAFHATAGEFRKGLRSSTYSLGAAAKSLVAGTGEAMGLTDYANERFKEAEDYVRLSEATGPRVRDYRAVKDFTDVVDLTEGIAGSALAAFAPVAAGAAVGGLRGAAAGMFAPEMGSQLLRTRGAPASPQKKLGVAAAEAGVSTAAGLAVPVGAVAKMAGKAASGVGTEVAKAAGTMGALSAGQERARQAAHTIVDPERPVDQAEENAALVNAGLAGAVTGAPFGLASKAGESLAAARKGIADKLGPARELPGDRTQTTDEAKAGLGVKDRPLKVDPDLEKMPDDPEQMGAALDAHDAEVDAGLAAKEKEPWAKQYEGWREDPEKRDAFAEAAQGAHRDEVDRPHVARLLEGLKQLVDKRTPKSDGAKSEKRTALDVAIFDHMVKSLPEELAAAMTPKQKLELAGYLKNYALHIAGRKEEQPGPGKPKLAEVPERERSSAADTAVRMEQVEGPREATRVVPHELMAFFGKDLHSVVSGVQKILGRGGLKVEQPATKAEFTRAEKRRGQRMTRLEETVLSHLRPEHLADPATRGLVVKEMTRSLANAVNHGVQNWKNFDAQLDYAFGGNKDKVLEAFDAQREDITRTYEDMGEPRTDESTAEKLRRNEQFHVTEEDEAVAGPITEPEASPTGEQSTKAEQLHPYRDARLGVPMDSVNAKHAVLALRADPAFDPKVVKLRIEPEVKVDPETGKETLTGRSIIYAEDAEAPVGFDREALDRIREQHGKAGLENSVVSVVRKNPTEENPNRNETVAVSIPNLMAEVARTYRRQGRSREQYAHDAVMEGLTRLMSDPDFVRFAESSKEGGWNFPDEMKIGKFEGKMLTWGDVQGKGLSSRELRLQRLTTDMVQSAKHAPSIEAVKELGRQMERNRDRAAGDESAVRRMDDAIEEVSEEVKRREDGGDFPSFDKNRELGIKSTEEIGEGDVERQRPYDESTGQAIGREPLKTRPDLAATAEAKEQFKRELKSKEQTGEPRAEPESVAARRAKDELEERAKAAWRKDNPTGEWENEKPAVRRKYMVAAGYDKLPKFSEMRLGAGRITPEHEAAVRAHVEKVLGPEAAVKFLDGMEHAGHFMELNGVETLVVSVHALDPKGVGYHESMHALLERLSKANPEAANVLMNAASSPTIMAKLRKLLDEHPAALEQLKDPSERAAYMYEFWAGDQLKVGPQLETVFDKVKNVLKKALHALFGVGEDMSQAAKAEQLMRAFHDGRLADRSAAGEVLAKLMPRGLLADHWSARIGEWANRTWSTADGYIRDQKIPAFNQAADLLFNPGEGKAGLVQSRVHVRNQFMNRYAEAVKGMDDAALSRVLHLLQRGSDEGTGRLVGETGVATSGPQAQANAAERAAVKAIRATLDDLFKYMKEKGVKAVEWNNITKEYEEHDIHQLPNFFPRAYDRDTLVAKMPEFIQLLKKYGVDKPEDVAAKLVTPTKAAPGESDHTAGLTYYAPNTMARKLAIPDAELAPFMKKDLGSIMYDYINYTTRRGEYAVRAGNQGQEIARLTELAKTQGATDAQLKSFSKYVQAMEGSLGNDIDPKLRKFMGAMLTYQNFRLLPLSLFSSLIDPLGIAVRGGSMGDAFGAFTRGVRELVATKEDDARSFARAVGAINEATEEHMVSEMYGQNYGANWQKWLNDKLFRLNGMESWNNSMRTSAAAAAREFIIRHAERPGEHSERYLAELGLSKDDVHVKDGVIDLTPAVVDAVNRWVDGAVLRPHAGVRPIWASDPHFMLVAHLKQFTYSFQKTINERVVNEALHGNYKPLMVLSAYVPSIIAADVLRAAVTPGGGDDTRLQKWDLKDWLVHGVNRAGISGPGQYALDTATDLKRGKLGIESMGGPTVQQAMDIMRAAAGGGDMGRQGLRALPFYTALNPGG